MVNTQVIVTCTTINEITIISTLVIWIGTKIHDHREKKKEEQAEKAEIVLKHNLHTKIRFFFA